MPKTRRFETEVIHAGIRPDQWQGATLPPIYLSAAHAHSTAESLSETFAGRTDEHIYGRLSNPTTRALEEKLAVLEGGAGALVTASGMAAISSACSATSRCTASRTGITLTPSASAMDLSDSFSPGMTRPLISRSRSWE